MASTRALDGPLGPVRRRLGEKSHWYLRRRSIRWKSRIVDGLSTTAERNPQLRVLGMSATPVINNLLEARKLLEITTGREFTDLDTQATVNNALATHRALMLHGFRQPAQYDKKSERSSYPTPITTYWNH